MIQKLQRAMAAVVPVVLVMLMTMDVRVSSSSSSSSACPPVEDEVGAEEMVHHSDLVVLGRVVRRLPDKGQNLQLYMVHMRVLCVYKGDLGSASSSSIINISAAANQSDPCPDHQMFEGRLYMAYLYKHGPSTFLPAFPHHPDSYKDEMFILCDLNVSIPAGPREPEDADVKCIDDHPADYDYEEPCVRYTTLRPGDTTRSIGQKVPPNQPGKTGKVEGGGGAGGGGSEEGNTSGDGGGGGGAGRAVPGALELVLLGVLLPLSATFPPWPVA